MHHAIWFAFLFGVHIISIDGRQPPLKEEMPLHDQFGDLIQMQAYLIHSGDGATAHYNLAQHNRKAPTCLFTREGLPSARFAQQMHVIDTVTRRSEEPLQAEDLFARHAHLYIVYTRPTENVWISLLNGRRLHDIELGDRIEFRSTVNLALDSATAQRKATACMCVCLRSVLDEKRKYAQDAYFENMFLPLLKACVFPSASLRFLVTLTRRGSTVSLDMLRDRLGVRGNPLLTNGHSSCFVHRFK
jgi:hypothetical protein